MAAQVSDQDESSSSESEWEEVPGDTETVDEVEYMKARIDNQIPKDSNVTPNQTHVNTDSSQGLKIIIPHPDGINRKKKKKGTDIIGNYIVRELNKCKKEVYLDLHRVSLLCHLARGFSYNKILRDESILSTALSILPSERAYPPKHLDLTYLEKFISWFKRAIVLDKEDLQSPILQNPPTALEKELLEQIGSRTAKSHTFLVFIFISILRALGVQVRLIMNLVPAPLKPDTKDLMKFLKAEDEAEGSQPSTSKAVKSKRDLVKSKSKETSKAGDKIPKCSKGSKASPKKESPPTSRSTRQPSKRIKKGSKTTLPDSDSEAELPSSDSSSSPSPKKRRKAAPRRSSVNTPDSKKSSKGKVQKSQPRTLAKKISSVMDEVEPKASPPSSQPKTKVESNFWPEVFLEEEEQWICVDVAESKIMAEATVKAKATHPIAYVIAFSNSGHVKDVTGRYSDRWWTDLGKVRDDEWWMKTIKPYRSRRTVYDRQEDENLLERLEVLELPKTVAAFKNHPRYALKRHLLKFEAIYPPDVMPCGTNREELVYPRSSVHTLCSRETWLRQARVVRIGEKPYKIVKSRPKYNKVLGSLEEAQPLDLFGLWQTEDYQPEVAVDGRVPRNAYGNVDLYLPKMLPIGTVHLQLAGLDKVGRKLNLDCAKACVGFEFHAGGCHPKFDGFIVCEEFKDIFLDAWKQEQSEAKQRAEEKRRERIYERWAKLCKLLLIRKKLEKRYGFDLSGNPGTEPKAGKSSSR